MAAVALALSALTALLARIADDADDAGCEDSFVVSGNLIEEARGYVYGEDGEALGLPDGAGTAYRENFALLRDVVDDADNTGCEDAYVVSASVIERLRLAQ